MTASSLLVAAAVLVALGAGWVSWVLFALAVMVVLTARGIVTALKLNERKPPQ